MRVRLPSLSTLCFLAASTGFLLVVGCAGGIEGKNPGECADLADNDADGLFDCLDPDCQGAPDCAAQELGVQGEGFCAVLEVLSLACVQCHSPSLGPLGDLDLSEDAHSALVGRPSVLDPSLTLVVPGEPESSFLLDKLVGTLSEGQGERMPQDGPLHPNDIAIVREWVAAGAAADCVSGDDDDDAVTETYHPPGWDEPAAHGPALKLFDENCKLCHGPELDGGQSKVGCDGCHEKDWRENCTYCHGGTDSDTGAPPRDLDGETVLTSITFPPHTSHVSESNHAPYDCVECHTKPSNVTSEGHLLDDTHGEAEVVFTAGLSNVAHYDGVSGCSNLYCHGDGQSANGVQGALEQAPGCDGCHAGPEDSSAQWSAMSGEHNRHLDVGVLCVDCHAAVVSAPSSSGTAISAPALHVNGVPDVAQAGEMTFDALQRTCTGSCHACASCGPALHYIDPWVEER